MTMWQNLECQARDNERLTAENERLKIECETLEKQNATLMLLVDPPAPIDEMPGAGA
jgi:hypothetical protein